MDNKLSVVGKLSEYYSENPIVRSLLQLVPGWGSADTLLQERANQIRSERLKALFNELAEGKHELTEELIQSEDFLHGYFCTLRAVINTRHKEKIRLFARLLRNSVSGDAGYNPDEYDELVSILYLLSLREFKALLLLHNLEAQYPRKSDENDLQNTLTYWKEFQYEITKSFGIPMKYFAAFMAKIERTGLYLRITGNYYDYNGDVGRTTDLFTRLLEYVQESS